MPHLAFDLDALKMVPDAARAAGVAESELGYGLVRLWGYCWTTKTERVKKPHLAGFFGGDVDRVAQALDAFNFLEEDEAGIFRVRGVQKYLRISRAQSEGGKQAAARGNLKKGQEPATPQAGEALEESSSSPGGIAGEDFQRTSSASPGLHRAPNTSSLSSRDLGTAFLSESSLLSEQETSSVCRRSPAEQLQEAWNAHPELPRWKENPPKRRERARQALKERDLGSWVGVIAKIASSAFCAGQNDRGWRADPDWLLQPGVATKVLEGKYDNGPATYQAKPSRPDPNGGITRSVSPVVDPEPCVRCGGRGHVDVYQVGWLCGPCFAQELPAHSPFGQKEASR